MSSKVRLWRWRRNPLRRRSDLVEAWVGLVTVLLVLTAAPACGWLAGTAADRALQRTVRVQRSERSQVPAVVVRFLPWRPGTADTEPARVHNPRLGALVRWTGPDGATHTGTVRIDKQQRRTGWVLVWTDRHGALVEAPLDVRTATVHAVLVGLGAAVAVAALPATVWGVVRRQLMRRRLDQWERDWVRVAPQWGRAGTGG